MAPVRLSSRPVSVGWVASAALAVALAGCVGSPDAGPAPEPSRPPAPASTATAPTPDPQRVEPTPNVQGCREPLLLATRYAAPRPRISVRQARRWVRRPPAGIRVLPASEVSVTDRVAVVGGVHPLRRPAAYPLTTEGACPPRPVRMTVVGDVMLGRRVATAAGGDPARPLRAVATRLRAADLVVGNLESTLSRAGPPQQGGDSFAAPPTAGRALREAGFDVVSLANNHAGDFGPVALEQTVRRLRAAGLGTFGAGSDLAAARRPAVVEVRGSTYGFLGFNAIGETPTAGPGRPGAVSVSMPPRTGPLDRAELRRFLGDVRRLARRVDVVVVLPHWGTQYTAVPEPVQRDVARRLADAGADLVVGGHPHWVQGVQRFGRTLVVHSLGNFVFDMDFSAETMAGVVLETTWWDGRLVEAVPVPYRMDASFTPRFVGRAAGLPTLRLMWSTSAPAFRP